MLQFNECYAGRIFTLLTFSAILGISSVLNAAEVANEKIAVPAESASIQLKKLDHLPPYVGGLPYAISNTVMSNLSKAIQPEKDVCYEVKLKISGTLNVQYVSLAQRKFFSDFEQLESFWKLSEEQIVKRLITANKNRKRWGDYSGIENNTGITFEALKEGTNGLKYGGVIGLNADVSQGKGGDTFPASKTYIFFESPEIGRIELGSYDGAGKTMKISAASIANATGGIDGDYQSVIGYRTITQDQSEIGSVYLGKPFLPYTTDNTKRANKITYYTTPQNGFIFGASYVPDVQVLGTIYSLGQYRTGGYRNVFEVAAKYEGKLENEMSIGGSIIGEIGEANNINTTDPKISTRVFTLKRNDLLAYEIGAKFGYKDLTVAASYGDWGKSGTVQKTIIRDGLTVKMEPGPVGKTSFYTLGMTLVKEKFTSSLTYFNSKRSASTTEEIYLISNKYGWSGQNSFDAVSLGVEYKLIPGFLPYAEATRFSYKTQLPNVVPNNGCVFIVGTKLSF